MSEINLLLGDYFNILNNNNNENIDNRTATYHENNLINENFLSINKPSIELIKQLWNDNKSKDIKLIDHFNFNKFLNINDNKYNNNCSPVLIINDDDLRLIAINSNYVIEFSKDFINLNNNYINDLAASAKAHANPKIGMLIKISLSNGQSNDRTLSQSSSIDDGDECKNINKKNLCKKSKRKNRSMSESYCDVIKTVTEQLQELNLDSKGTRQENETGHQPGSYLSKSLNFRKSRSYSESHDGEDSTSQDYNKIKKYKGILKNTIYNNPSTMISETSEEDISNSFSVDWIDNRRNSDCSKKSVRFSDVIRKQLFRVNSSILGQRKKNHKKNVSRRRAQDRKLSESENSENEDHKNHFTKNTDKINNRNI